MPEVDDSPLLLSPQVTVLRLGHRLVRDTRMSTHVGLVARAFGASKLIMSGAEEDETIDSIERVAKRWGRKEKFLVIQTRNWREVVKKWKGVVIHLTMYGEAIDEALPTILSSGSKASEILVIIGAEKVPAEVYGLAHFNVAVGNQPHSEVAALAIFLDRIYKGRELYSTFTDAKIRVKPNPYGRKEVEFLEK